MDDVLATLPSSRKRLAKVTPDGALGTPLIIMDDAREADGLVFHLRLVLGFNLEPGEDGYDEAAATFIRLGPFGLHPVIEFLYQVYQKALESNVLTPDNLHLVCAQIDEVASRMYMHVLAFRTSHPRDLYDPHPVGFLSRMLQAHRSKFAVRCLALLVSSWLTNSSSPMSPNGLRHWIIYWDSPQLRTMPTRSKWTSARQATRSIFAPAACFSAGTALTAS